ncbi:MAG: SLC13 family permease, partial [Bacteroidota bacterium]
MDSTITLVILALTVVLFVWGKWKPDVVALMSMLALFLTGVLTPKEALSGFSNPTVIMIGALFIIGEGLAQTGWTAVAGQTFITWARGSKNRMLAILIGGAGLLSGFVSNTGTVATLLPLAVNSAWNMGTFPSKVLIPVAYGANTGGLLTLTGTPPNIVVNDALSAAGFDAFFFFEFALIGLPLLILAILYFRIAGAYILPAHPTENRPVNLQSQILDWMEAYQVDDNYYRLRVRSISPLLGTRIDAWNLEENYQVSIIKIKRRHPNPLKGIPQYIQLPEPDTEFMYHDLITVKGEPAMIEQFMLKFRLGLWPRKSGEEEMAETLLSQEVGMAEMIITPKSTMVGKRIVLGEYLNHLGIQLLAASRNNQPMDQQSISVRAGDAFLIRGTWRNIEALKLVHKNIAIVGRPEAMTQNIQQLTPHSFIALGALLFMVLILIFKLMPGAFAALLAAGLVVLSGCVSIDKAYHTISWTSVIMLAG